MADLIGIMDISKLKVPDLKRELKARGLTISGNKNELMERLQGALNKAKMDDTVSAESVDDLDEDLLNDDELDQEHLEASDAVLNDIDLDSTNPVESLPKRKLNEINSVSKPAKKIVLNRNSSVDQVEEEEVQNGANGCGDAAEKQDDKKVVKLSELSAKERLEMRVKKFGAPLSGDAQKQARAERFNSGTKGGIAATGTASMDVLKKRAERFGGSVSTVMSKLEMEDRIKRRKERFGVVANANGSVTDPEKAKRRLERFKEPVT